MTDRLRQVGKSIRKTKTDAEYSLQRYSQNFPMIERIRDTFNEATPFFMEFMTYIDRNNVQLNLYFNPVYGITSVEGDGGEYVTFYSLDFSDTSEVIYPEDVRIWVDNVDITRWITGANTLSPDGDLNIWRDIDISTFVKGSAVHTLKLTCLKGGKVEARIAIR